MKGSKSVTFTAAFMVQIRTYRDTFNLIEITKSYLYDYTVNESELI